MKTCFWFVGQSDGLLVGWVRKGVRIRFSVGVKVRVRTGQGLKLVIEQYGGQINPAKFF